MGVVYKARNSHLKRFVALKVLPPEKVTDPERKQRFVREARAASALNHPNIVTVYDIDQSDGVDFIAMEHVEGKTLDELIGHKGMKLNEALKYALQIADALAKAHAAGIVHRDLKPGNVMVTAEGRVKVLDFGLAKLTETAPVGSEDSTLTAAPSTELGVIVGTAAYMSPEQAEGKKVDARSDIFSFGSLLYEMLTGRRPFRRDSQALTLAAILHLEPPALPEGTPSELERIVARCLRKDPARRFQTMADLKVTLEEMKEESDSGAAAMQTVPPRRRWVWVALLPVLLVAGFFAWRMWWSPQSAEPFRAVALTTLPGVKGSPSFSPDGNYVAFAWSGPKQENFDIYVQQIGAGSPLRLTADPRRDYDPAWSPDGRWIAFLRGESRAPGSIRTGGILQSGTSELRLIPPLGGPERKLAEIRTGQSYFFATFLAWCPDSDCLVVTDSPGQGKPDALFVVSLETGEKRQLTNPQPPLFGDTHPAVSPDGRWLVFERESAPPKAELQLLPLGKNLTSTGEPTPLPFAGRNRDYTTWMPDSKEILFSTGGSLWRVAIPGDHPPARLPFVGENATMAVVSRPQPGRPSRLVYVRSVVVGSIWRIETSAPGAPASSPPIATITSTREDANPQFSPDGRRVAFESNRSRPNEIWLADPDGSNAVQLTSMATLGADWTGMPRWSPDGQLVAFESNPKGKYGVYVISAAGGKPKRLISDLANEPVASFSHDGKWIYFSSNRTGEFQIWKVPATGGEAVQVTHNVGYVAFESPDGAYLYYTQTPDASALWRLPTSGGPPVKVVEGVIQRAFAVLEKGIYYIDQPSVETRLQFYDLATGRSTTVARNLGDVELGLTASPGGRTILYTRLDSSVNDLMLVENFR